MDRLLITLNGVIDTAYVIFMTPGRWLASILIEHAPSLAASLGIIGDASSGLAPIILTILAWMIIALLVRRLFYTFKSLAKAIGVMFTRLYFRSLIAVRGYKTVLVNKFDMLDSRNDAGDVEVAKEFKLTRLDMMVMCVAQAGGPGFALSAPELADRFRLRPDQVQQSLEKLSENKLLDHVVGTTDGYENYRLNKTGTYIVTMWQRQQPAA